MRTDRRGEDRTKGQRGRLRATERRARVRARANERARARASARALSREGARDDEKFDRTQRAQCIVVHPPPSGSDPPHNPPALYDQSILFYIVSRETSRPRWFDSFGATLSSMVAAVAEPSGFRKFFRIRPPRRSRGERPMAFLLTIPRRSRVVRVCLT